MGIKKIPQSIFFEKCGCVVQEKLLYMLVPKSLRGQLLLGLGSFYLPTLRLKGLSRIAKYPKSDALWDWKKGKIDALWDIFCPCNTIMHQIYDILLFPINLIYAGMTPFYYASIPTRGIWFKTNQPEHKSDDWVGDTVTSVCVTMGNIWLFSSKFHQHLSLYCGAVKLKLQTGPGYWFLWESCEIWFPKFTDNFGIVSSKMHLRAVTILIPLE